MAEEEKAGAETGEGEEAGKEKKDKGGLKKILMIAIGVVVILLIVIVVASKVAKKAATPPELEFEPEIHEEEEPPLPALHTYDMGDYIARLTDIEETHFVKITKLAIAYNAEKYELISAEIGERRAQVEDIINTILLGQTIEVATVEGKEALRKEIVEKINGVLREGKIEDVYFQIIVQ